MYSIPFDKNPYELEKIKKYVFFSHNILPKAYNKDIDHQSSTILGKLDSNANRNHSNEIGNYVVTPPI